MAVAIPEKFKQSPSSSIASVNSNGRVTSRAQSGKVRITNSYTSRNYDFQLVFRLLSATEKDELDVFYDANQGGEVSFDFIHDGKNYTCRFTDIPLIYGRDGPDAFTVVFSLTGQPT